MTLSPAHGSPELGHYFLVEGQWKTNQLDLGHGPEEKRKRIARVETKDSGSALQGNITISC